MKKYLSNPCNIYISLLAFYSMQGTIIPTGGSLLSQIILLIAMLMGLFYTAKTMQMNGKPIYFKGLNILFLTLVVYGVISLLSDHHYIIKAKLFDNEVSKSSYLKSLFLSFPNIYTFYYFSRKNLLTESSLRKWVIAFLGIAIFRFFDYKITTIHTLLLNGNDVEEITNNMGFLFVALMPGVVLFKNNIKLQYSFLIVCMIFIMMGMKRGSIIVGVVSLIYYLYFNFKYNKQVSKGKVLFFSILIIVADYFITEHMMESSDYFMSRITQTREGDSSGRNEIYEHFWNHFKNEMDTFKFLFGNGANATLDIGINYAHNDWLELAINQGVLGLVVYAIYWLCFWKTIRSIKYNKPAKLVLSLTFMSFFIMTLFSMSYTEYSFFSCTVFGYYLAQYKECEVLYNINNEK